MNSFKDYARPATRKRLGTPGTCLSAAGHAARTTKMGKGTLSIRALTKIKHPLSAGAVSVNRGGLQRGGHALKSIRMTDQAPSAAIARIDRAIERIDRAVRAREAANGDMAGAYARLEQRHDGLRERIQETIAHLDTLIAGHDGGGTG